MKADQKSVIICRLMLFFALASLIFRWAIFSLPIDYLNPPLFSYHLELAFRALKFFGISDWIIGSQTGATIFSISLVFLALLGVIFPRKNWVMITFSLFYFIYYLSYNTVTINHSHMMTMMVWAAVPFWARKPENRIFLLDWLRYYACFIYVISFIFKITGGSLFYRNNGVDGVRSNLAQYMYQFPDTFTTHLLTFSFQYPAILNLGNIFIYLIEGLMVIGFFTKKYDHWLLWVPIIIHLSTYLYSDVLFIEMWVMMPLFLSDKQLFRLAKNIPAISK